MLLNDPRRLQRAACSRIAVMAVYYTLFEAIPPEWRANGTATAKAANNSHNDDNCKHGVDQHGPGAPYRALWSPFYERDGGHDPIQRTLLHRWPSNRTKYTIPSCRLPGSSLLIILPFFQNGTHRASGHHWRMERVEHWISRELSNAIHDFGQ